MEELVNLCGVDNVDGWSLDQLRGCVDYAGPLIPGTILGITIGACALVCLAVGLAGGHSRVFASIEGLLYGAIAAYGGSYAGLVLAMWIHPFLMGAWLSFLAAACLFFAVRGTVTGSGGAGWKALGWLLLLALAGAFAAVAYVCFTVPEESAAAAYQGYLRAVTWLFTLCAVLDAMMVAVYGCYHGAAGWLLVFVNSTWGALGNLLGLAHHAASWSFNAKHGDIRPNKRSFYTCYNDGIRFRAHSAFTLGGVMTGPPVEKHESHHVIQHLVFGPIFVISYLLWMVLLALPGLIVGLAKKRGITGIEAWSYYNNPWEIWAYAVEGGRSVGGDTTLIWGRGVSWTVSILYYAACVALFALLIWWRH